MHDVALLPLPFPICKKIIDVSETDALLRLVAAKELMIFLFRLNSVIIYSPLFGRLGFIFIFIPAPLPNASDKISSFCFCGWLTLILNETDYQQKQWEKDRMATLQRLYSYLKKERKKA